MIITTNVDKVFSESLKKVAAPVQLTQPIMETSTTSPVTPQPSNIDQLLNQKGYEKTEGKIPSHKDIISSSIYDLNQRMAVLRKLLVVIDASRPDDNTKQALDLVGDCSNSLNTLRKYLKSNADI